MFRTIKSSNRFINLFNICIILFSVAKIIHNERIKRDIENYKMEDNQHFKIRHIIIDHFKSIYLEQHLKHWIENVKNHFMNIPETNVSITIPEAIQKFYVFFHQYKKDVRNYFEEQFLELPKDEKHLIKQELLNYVNGLSDTDRVKMRYVHRCWELETEIDHACEDQIESIYDALDSINIVADVNFYNHLRKMEDPKDIKKKIATPWELGCYLSHLNEGLMEHVEKEKNDYDVSQVYQQKLLERRKHVHESLNNLNKTYGNVENVKQQETSTPTPETIATYVR